MTRHYTYDNLPNSENWNWWDNLGHFFWGNPKPAGDSRLPLCNAFSPSKHRLNTANGGCASKSFPNPGENMTGCTFYSEHTGPGYPAHNCVGNPGTNSCMKGTPCHIPRQYQ